MHTQAAIAHKGDPCTFCDVPHDEVAPGPCTNPLTSAYSRRADLIASRAVEGDAWVKRKAALDAGIAECDRLINLAASDISIDKVALAETVLSIGGLYSKGGQDRASVVADAILQLSTGQPRRPYYGDLWRVRLATKNYDAWSGQRSDCEYGCGPRHGSICFSVGLSRDVRARDHQALTPAETEAAIYYLHNLEKIQAAKAQA